MRDSVRFFHPRNLLPALAALLLSACGDGGGARSPDLPFPELLSFTVSCPGANPLEIDATAQCVTPPAGCLYRETLAGGVTRQVSRDCPTTISWSINTETVATISDSGLVTGRAPGTAVVTGSVDGVNSTAPVRVVEGTLVDATIACSPDSIPKGDFSNCAVVGNCRYNVDGQIVEKGCPAPVWSADIGTINASTGRYNGTAVGTATITARFNDLTRTDQVTVTNTCLQSIVISTVPTGITSVPAGSSVTYAATALYRDGTSNSVTSTTEFSTDDPTVASFPQGVGQNTLSTNPALAAQDSVIVTGTYRGATQVCNGGSTTDTETLTVRLPQLTGLCLEPAEANGAFQNCRNQDTGACVAAPISVTLNTARDLRLRARYGSGAEYQECNITNSGTFTSSNASIVSLSSNDAATGRGRVTGQAAGSATITASATIAGQPQTANSLTVNVRLAEVLGSNSVAVSAKSLTIPGQQSKFACVGATDLVGGLSDSSRIQGLQRLYAGARFCTESERVDGSCVTFIDGDTYRDVTNQDGGTTPAGENRNRIDWNQSPGYWNGQACVTTLPALPIGNGAPAIVGDDPTPDADYAVGNRLAGQNGVVVGTGNLRIGFTCVTAEYSNPLDATNKDLDGMTVLVLPVTNDVVLGSSNDEDATQLCAALESVFQLGSSPNGGNGVVTQILSAVTEIVNPILQALAAGDEIGNTGPIPVDDIVDQLLTALSDPLTRTLFESPLGDLVDLLDNTVYAPVLCGVDSLLTAILTGNPAAIGEAQLCVPEVPTFPFPAAP